MTELLRPVFGGRQRPQPAVLSQLPKLYFFRVHERTKSGEKVGRVLVTDEDESKNPHITYVFVVGSAVTRTWTNSWHHFGPMPSR